MRNNKDKVLNYFYLKEICAMKAKDYERKLIKDKVLQGRNLFTMKGRQIDKNIFLFRLCFGQSSILFCMR